MWRSTDLTGATILLAGTAAVTWYLPSLAEKLRGFTVWVIREACSPHPPAPELVVQAALHTVIETLAPLLGATIIAAVAINLLQVRPLWTLRPLKPQLTRLDPITGFKKLFGFRGLFTATISTAKLLVVAIVLIWTVVRELRNLVLLAHAGPALAASAVGQLVASLLLRGALVLLALSLLDVLYQRHRYLKDQRMTKEEVKREHRETEGDQSQKGERRRLHQELLEQAMIDEVRKADVVIVNPDHLAVALGYDPEQDEAPVVLARGQNLVARKIVEAARRYGIPVLRDVHLARSLAGVEVGAHIPEELYEAVAEILRVMIDHDGSHG